MPDYYSDFRCPVVASFQGSSQYGAFDPLNFMIRMSPQMQLTIRGNEHAVRGKADVSADLLSASGTYFHETFHWWQIVGTTFGFVDALSIQSQANTTIGVLQQYPPKQLVKPLCDVHMIDQQAIDGLPLNKAVNAWMDIEFAHALAHAPQRLGELQSRSFFESPGHSFYYLYHDFCNLFSHYDAGHKLFPNPLEWLQALDALKAANTPSYARGAPCLAAELGMLDIMEGQARILELRYLARATGVQDWAYYEQAGYLGPLYRKALDYFSAQTGISVAQGPLSSAVNLFLLVCDIAMNPATGYPAQIRRHEWLYRDTHPGLRFTRLCLLIGRFKGLADVIQTPDRANYDALSAELCRPFGWRTPAQIAQTITTQVDTIPTLSALRAQADSLDYGEQALHLELFLSLHLRHMRSKAESPEFFCWPDAFFESNASGPLVAQLANANMQYFNRHTAPFEWFESDQKIHPNINLGQHETRREWVTVQYFLRRAALDVVRQLSAKVGPFDFSFFWNNDPDNAPFVTAMVEQAIGMRLGDVVEI